MAVAASRRIAEEVSVCRNACRGCTTLRGKRRPERDHVGRRPSEGPGSSSRSGGSVMRNPLPTSLPGAPSELLHLTCVATDPGHGQPSRVLATSTEPPSVTPNRVQRGANKKHRLPLALLIVPVVLVAIGVAIVRALRGGGGAH